MRTIFFICYGNICRSPFAERYATLRSESLGLTEVVFDSAGVGASLGQACPKAGVRAAALFEVDLSPHRAKPMEEIHPGPKDLLIAMDRFVFGALALSLAGTLDSVRGPGGARLQSMMQFLQGTPTGDHVGPDVPDPIGGSVAAYRASYEILTSAVDRFLEQLD